jgi:hypothetical protein
MSKTGIDHAVELLNKSLSGMWAFVSREGEDILVWMPGADDKHVRFAPADYHRLEPFLMGMRYANELRPSSADLAAGIKEVERAVVVGYFGDHRVTKGILSNGGDRINFARAMHDPVERARLEEALERAYPIE